MKPVNAMAPDALEMLFAPWLQLPEDFGHPRRNRLFSPSRTFWLFLAQVLSKGGACREMVHRFLAERVRHGGHPASPRTGAYCRARGRLRMEDIQSVYTALAADGQVRNFWCCRTVSVVDGSSVSMPDTPENQRCYPQPKGQKPGCGFPVLRLVAVFSLATGFLLGAAKDALAVSERTLYRRLWHLFEAGTVLLCDRGFCSYAELYLLKMRDLDCVTRNHQCRSKGVRRLEKLGKGDYLVEWSKTKVRPKWMTKEEWDALPSAYVLRQCHLNIEERGFRTKSIVVTTTLLDPRPYTKEALAQLYRRRWRVELYLRDLKTTMAMDVLRCKTPDMVDKELTMYFIAYNLIRALTLQVAHHCKATVDRISFEGACAAVRQWAPVLAATGHADLRRRLHTALLHAIARDTLPLRPNRNEPRARKRRPKNYPLLTNPREDFQEIPHRNRYRKP